MLIVTALVLSGFVAFSPVFAENDDFIILLDQSMSMLENEPGNPAKRYAKRPQDAEKSREALNAIDEVIDKLLHVGDYVSVVLFGNDARVIVSQQLQFDHERGVIKDTVAHLLFTDTKTDIVAGVQKAGDLITQLGSKERRKILVMITDGKNDPDKDSPFFNIDEQQRVYSQLKRKIKDGQWKVALIGLGAHTDISDVSRNLGLKEGNTITIAPGTDIQDRLFQLIKKERDSKVAADKSSFKIKLTPNLFGGYEAVSDEIGLTSTFDDPIEIKITADLDLIDLPGLSAHVAPSFANIAPGDTDVMRIAWRFEGTRPDDGLLRGRYGFTFAVGSTPFYPHVGEVELVLTSWWDLYGLWLLLAVASIVVVTALLYRAVRKRQVPEIKVQIAAGAMPLSEPTTLRKKGRLEIANGDDLAAGAANAPGLDPGVAATVIYLGRRRFRVIAAQATILYNGEEKKIIEIGLDDCFDLKDDSGHRLSTLSVTTPGSLGDDAFGASNDASPF